MAFEVHAEIPVTTEEAGLVGWFLELTAAQRLAELESRIAFLTAARTYAHDDPQLSPHNRDIPPP